MLEDMSQKTKRIIVSKKLKDLRFVKNQAVAIFNNIASRRVVDENDIKTCAVETNMGRKPAKLLKMGYVSIKLP